MPDTDRKKKKGFKKPNSTPQATQPAAHQGGQRLSDLLLAESLLQLLSRPEALGRILSRPEVAAEMDEKRALALVQSIVLNIGTPATRLSPTTEPDDAEPAEAQSAEVRPAHTRIAPVEKAGELTAAKKKKAAAEPLSPALKAVPTPAQPKARANGENIYEGKLEMGRDGVAQVVVASLGEPVNISSNGLMRAFHGDVIRFKLDFRGKHKLEGTFLEVVRHARTEYVGTVERGSKGWYFTPQENKVRPEFILHSKGLNGATKGDKAVAEIVSWAGRNPEAEIVRVLGAAGTHSAEMNAIVMEFGLEADFTSETLAESNAIPALIPAKEIEARRDFRDTLTLTIDPLDAKDFDDAISFRDISEGKYEIGVHIADVSYYVKEGTALDSEAFERGTSVYLVDRTIPMLPERLSNDLCSLRPEVDRLVFSAVFHINDRGEISDEWYGRGIIKSNRRFTYEEVQDILDAQDGFHGRELLILNRIAHALRKERFAEGSINFETEEVKFRLDEQFRPVEVYRKVRKDAHKLVEDFMLLANRRVAKYVAKFRKKPEVPMVYRIHDLPNVEKIANLAGFAAGFGYKMDTSDKKKTVRSINKLVLDVIGKPEENVVQTVAIRSMPKAIYTTHNVGHFGLGFEYYTHFTSPIRRYPDVLCHRILQQVLSNNITVDEETLEAQCKYASEREKKAADAERASIKYKQVEYLESVLGQTFDGMVSGVTEWGIYVELDGNKCEGMIMLRDLHDDHYEMDEKNYRLVGRRTGKTYRLGDRMRVQVKKTNLAKRIADFKLVQKLS